MQDGLTQFRILHYFRRLRIKNHAVDVGDRTTDDIDFAVRRQGLDLIGRHFRDDVKFTGAQTGDTGREFRNFDKADLLRGTLVTPVLIVANQFQTIRGLERDDLIGAGTNGFLYPIFPRAGFFETVLRNDFRHAGRKAQFDQGIGRFHRHAHGVIVNLFDAL